MNTNGKPRYMTTQLNMDLPMNALQLNAQIPYATDEELQFITARCKTLEPTQSMVIIGAGPGVMLMAAREGGTEFPIMLIDIATCHYAKTHLGMAGLDENVLYTISDSSVVGRNWGGADIDFLIIDGDHSQDGVKKDLDAWLPHIAHKGAVFIHDYDATGTRFANQERYPGTAEAVSDSILMNLFKPIARPGTAIVFERLD